jgi:hypothetical protein
MPIFMDAWMRAFPRKAGNGHNVGKIHKTGGHVGHDMMRFGPMAVTNGGCLENLHRTRSKKPAALTQKRHKTVELQSGKRNSENIIIDKAYLSLEGNVGAAKARKRFKADNTVPLPTYKGKIGTVIRGKDSIKWEQSVTPSFSGPLSVDQVISFFAEHVFPFISEDQVTLYSQTTRNNTRFVANPSFGKDALARQHWATMRFHPGGRNRASSAAFDVPCHLLCMFLLESDPSQPIHFNGCDITSRGLYVFCHSISQQLNVEETDPGKCERAHTDCRLLFRCQKYDREVHGHDPGRNILVDKPVQPTLLVYSTDMIASPCIAFPDFYLEESCGVFYILRPHEEWGPDFIEVARQHCASEKNGLPQDQLRLYNNMLLKWKRAS